MVDIAKNGLLALVSTALFLIVFEGGSRSIRPVSLPDPLITSDRFQPGGMRWDRTRVPDDELFWRMRPDLVIDGTPYTNSLGLRGSEIPGKSPREFRILSLGESTTFGWNLPPRARTYSELLEKRLATSQDRPVRVVNAGSPGYSSFQGFTYLRTRGLELEPDAVLLYFGYNDFLPATFRIRRSSVWADDRGMTDKELYQQRHRLLGRLSAFLLEHSNLFRLAMLRGEDPLAIATVDAERVRVPRKERIELLEAFRALCDRHELALVVIIPWYRDFDEHIPLLRRFGADTGTPVIDLPEKLADTPKPRAHYFIDETHPTAEGHRLIAAAIAAELRGLWQP